MPQMSTEDKRLIELASSFVNLRVRDFHDLTGRGEHALRERLLHLLIARRVRWGEKKGEDRGGLGIFYRIPNPSNPFELVYFLTQKGWDEALHAGYVHHEVNATKEKSDGQLDHDLVLTDFHKALHFAFGDFLTWSQLWRNRYTRWGKGTNDYVNADAIFDLEQPSGEHKAFFVEVENQKGVQEPMRKMEGYLRFAESGEFQKKFEHPDFRVIFLKPTRDMAMNLLAAASAKPRVNTRRFWVNDYAAAINPREALYLTPRDYRERTYGLLST